MTEVNYVIEKGEAIPDDVIGMEGSRGSEWRLTSKGHWHLSTAQITCLHDDCGGDGYALMRAGDRPLTVTAVREPEPPQIEVVATTRVGGADVPIYAEVPERPVERAGWPEETDPAGNGCRYFDELLVALDAENVTSALAEIKRLKAGAPASDPSVLSLPRVPDGATLVGPLGLRWTAIGRRGLYACPEMTTSLRLGELLDEYGSLTVEIAPAREPRTWPKLDDADSTVRKVEVHGQGIWTRMPRTPNAWTQGIQVRTLGQLRELGEVIEVFDDEPGGAA